MALDKNYSLASTQTSEASSKRSHGGRTVTCPT